MAQNGPWEVSAIYDAIFKARDLNLLGAVLFSSNFPKVEDIKLVVAVGIKKILFNGPVDDTDTAKMLNTLTEEGISIDLIQLV